METMTKEQYKEKRENLDCKIREQIQQVNQELESLRAAANTDYSCLLYTSPSPRDS